jgi:aminoglycoside phosphotransferase (APT) family kinase protein
MVKKSVGQPGRKYHSRNGGLSIRIITGFRVMDCIRVTLEERFGSRVFGWELLSDNPMTNLSTWRFNVHDTSVSHLFVAKISPSQNSVTRQDLAKEFECTRRFFDASAFLIDEEHAVAFIRRWVSGKTIAAANSNFTCVNRRAALLSVGKKLRDIHAVPLPINTFLKKRDLGTQRSEALCNFDSLAYKNRDYLRPIAQAIAGLTIESHPLAVQHGDLNGGNIVIQDTGAAEFIDWSDAYIGCPTVDLGYICDVESGVCLNDLDRASLMNGYGEATHDCSTSLAVILFEVCVNYASQGIVTVELRDRALEAARVASRQSPNL